MSGLDGSRSDSSCEEIPSPPPPLEGDLFELPPFPAPSPDRITLPGTVDSPTEVVPPKEVVRLGLGDLPLDCQLCVCYFLNRSSLITASEISQSWSQAATSDDIWKPLFLTTVKYYPAFCISKMLLSMSDADFEACNSDSVRKRCVTHYGFVPTKVREIPTSEFRDNYIRTLSKFGDDTEVTWTLIQSETKTRAVRKARMDKIVDKVVASIWIFLLLGGVLMSTAGTIALVLEYIVEDDDRDDLRRYAIRFFSSSLALFFILGITYSCSCYRLRIDWDESTRKRHQGVAQKDSCFMNPQRVPFTNTCIYFSYWLSAGLVFQNILSDGVMAWTLTAVPILLCNGFLLLQLMANMSGMARFFYYLGRNNVWVASPATRDAGYGGTLTALGAPFWLQFLLVVIGVDSPDFMPCHASRFPTYALLSILAGLLVLVTIANFSSKRKLRNLWYSFSCFVGLFFGGLLTYYTCENGFVALCLLMFSMVVMSVNMWWLTCVYLEEDSQ